MTKHWLENPLIVHCDGSGGNDYTLCGYALEGETGNDPLTETLAQINCSKCIEIINFCRQIRSGEVCSPFQRRGINR
jgi:hypothetical protein